METDRARTQGYGWAAFIARWMLGLLFLMAGWFKVFEMGAVQHAQALFVEGYQDSWIPEGLLWATGFVIPFVELIAGVLLLVGWRVREVLVALGGLLLLVTYGHLLKEPFYDVTTHIFPRVVFLLILFALPRHADRWTLDAFLLRRKG